jgi:hypothetical protein
VGIWTTDTSAETLVGMRQLVKTIEKLCGDLLASHRRKCECSWSAWQNGDVSLLEIGDEITSYGECVQPLQSVKLS